MSVQAMGWVLEHSKSQGSTRCVLISIANHVGADGEGWAYVKQVMAEANCSHDTYQRAVQWAVTNGELEREINCGNAKRAPSNRKPNHFRLTQLGGAACGGRKMQAPADCPPQDTQIADPKIAPPEPSPVLEPYKEPSQQQPSTAVAAADRVPATRSRDAVERVFAVWQEATGKQRSKLDAKRRRLIVGALRSHGEADITDTVRGWRNSPFHCGENDRRQTYNDIELLLRDAKHIEQFRDLERNGPVPLSVSRNTRTAAEWAAATS